MLGLCAEELSFGSSLSYSANCDMASNTIIVRKDERYLRGVGRCDETCGCGYRKDSGSLSV